MTWPRGWALAEDFWSPNASKNWANFIQRVEKQFDRADVEGVNYSHAIYDAIVKVSENDGKMILNLDSEVPGLDIFYTVDGAMPNIYSPKYSRPVEIPDGPVTVRVVTYRDGKQLGHLITLNPEQLKMRATKN
jgi:hexosaminidase